MKTCKLCAAHYPVENETRFKGFCPECVIELEDLGVKSQSEANAVARLLGESFE